MLDLTKLCIIKRMDEFLKEVNEEQNRDYVRSKQRLLELVTEFVDTDNLELGPAIAHCLLYTFQTAESPLPELRDRMDDILRGY